MKTLHAGTAALLGALLVLTLGAQGARTPAPTQKPAVVVGTFDSRAIAVAWIRSKEYNAVMKDLHSGFDTLLAQARRTGDEVLVSDLEAIGPAMQHRAHQKGFGTAPVDDILARIEDRLPQIAREQGVDLIVSRWAPAWRDPAAQLVDVTDALVAEFHPDETTAKMVRELVKTDPLPAGDIKDDH